jgi:hypothetical protein
MVFQDVGYHTVLMPNEIDFENLSFHAHPFDKILIVVLMKMSFNDNATKYGHIIGLCPFFSSGCFQLKISIIEGAQPQLQAIQFTWKTFGGAVVMNHKQNFGDLNIFQEKHSQNDFSTVLAKGLTMD